MSILDPQARAAMLAEVYPDATAAQAAELFRDDCETALAIMRRNAREAWVPGSEDDLRSAWKRVEESRRRRAMAAWQRFADLLAAFGLEPTREAWRRAWWILTYRYPTGQPPARPVPIAMERRGSWVEFTFGRAPAG